ncbi:response regulator [Pseudonocardia charpentierae]|uniref:Response regulator transcription factor n=1 Tax=Pseudonocardia charpentierae TaxID=3075545 RepID=A0ABU2NBC4_9PSEU|nr:response regulator transcription factor [Pseudonocardia sp. DSM 45834]MDT0351255.1 response regulator transcription factor [Pseudonocardia sp. DSM 45834]
MIRVMVVDDHDFVRSTMCELIDGTDDLRVVGEAEDGARAVAVARETTPDVVLMDLSMPVLNGIDATRQVVAAVPAARVIVLTTSTRGQDVHDAAAAGAVGFLSKGADPDDVLEAIRAAGIGGTAWDRRSAEILRRAC